MGDKGDVWADGQTWLPVRKDYLVPVQALSRPFRGMVLDQIRRRHFRSRYGTPPFAVSRKVRKLSIYTYRHVCPCMISYGLILWHGTV